MVPSNDEVVRAVIAADDGMQQNLAGPCHPHGQGQQTEDGALLVVVVFHQGLVDTNPRVVVDVSRLGHADNRVNDEGAPDLSSRALGQFLMDSVEWVASLEGDHVLIAHPLEQGTHLHWSSAEVDKVVIARQVDDLQRATDADLVPARHLRDHGMLGVGRTVCQGALCGRIPVIDLIQLHDRHDLVVGVAQDELLTHSRQFGRVGRQCDR